MQELASLYFLQYLQFSKECYNRVTNYYFQFLYMKEVSIYSTPTCHFCHIAKDFFKENNIPYTEYDVSVDMAKRQEIVKRSGQMGVPRLTRGGLGFNSKPFSLKLHD